MRWGAPWPAVPRAAKLPRKTAAELQLLSVLSPVIVTNLSASPPHDSKKVMPSSARALVREVRALLRARLSVSSFWRHTAPRSRCRWLNWSGCPPPVAHACLLALVSPSKLPLARGVERDCFRFSNFGSRFWESTACSTWRWTSVEQPLEASGFSPSWLLMEGRTSVRSLLPS